MRRAKALEIVEHRLFQRRIAHEIGNRAHHLGGNTGFRHQRRTIGNLAHARDQAVQFHQIPRADQITHLGRALHHIGRNAAGIQIGVMNARIGWHVFAHVIHADIHELHRIQGAAAQMRRGGGVGRPAREGEINARIGQRHRFIHRGKRCRVPANRHIHIIKAARAHHETLGRTTFFRRAAIIAHPALEAVLREPILDRTRRQQGCGAEQIMPAAMPAAIARQGARFRDAGFLGQTRQRIIFTKDRDNWAFFARFAHHCRWDARHICGHAKAMRFQHGGMFGAGTVFSVAEFRHAPDAVTEFNRLRRLGIHQPPDFFGIAHCLGPLIGHCQFRAVPQASPGVDWPGQAAQDLCPLQRKPPWPACVKSRPRN